MRPKNIEVHIEELVLEGFKSGDENRIAGAVEHELTRQLAENGIPHSLTDIDHFDGGDFQAYAGSGQELIGRRVARAIYRGLNR